MSNKWVSFNQKTPLEGSQIITASINNNGVKIDCWDEWKDNNLNIASPPLNYWWDGEPNYDLAISKWWA